jgi:hypothetical protein
MVTVDSKIFVAKRNPNSKATTIVGHLFLIEKNKGALQGGIVEYAYKCIYYIKIKIIIKKG